MVIHRKPVILIAIPGTIKYAYNYKSESGGTGASGWSKKYYSGDGTADLSKVLATLSPWILGQNVFPSSWYDNTLWNSGTFGYTNNDTAQTDAGSETTMAIKALSAAEAVLGTIFTLTATKTDMQKMTVVDLRITQQDYNLACAASGADGGYSGPANGLLVDISWSSSISTTGDPPISGGSTVAVSPYLNLSRLAT